MASQDIAVQPLFSVLSVPSLLSGSQTFLLNALGGQFIDTLVDTDGLLQVGDPGSPTFGGDPVTYVGSGTAQPGISFLGITVPFGAPVDIVVMRVNGQYLLHVPEGPPNLLSAIAVVIDVDPVAYQVFLPVCFASGSRILMAEGERAVEDLKPGDMVRTLDNGLQPIRWIGRTRMRFTPAAHKGKPILFRKGSVAEGLPARDLRLSPQHRVLVAGDILRAVSGHGEALALAKGLTSLRRVRRMRGCRRVTYHTLLFDRHEVIFAEGLAVEIFLPGPFASRRLGARAAAEMRAAAPWTAVAAAIKPARPILKRVEAERLAKILRRRRGREAPLGMGRPSQDHAAGASATAP